MNTTRQWLGVEEAAAILGIAPYTVRDKLRRRELKGVKAPGSNRWRTKPEWIDSYLSGIPS